MSAAQIASSLSPSIDFVVVNQVGRGHLEDRPESVGNHRRAYGTVRLVSGATPCGACGKPKAPGRKLSANSRGCGRRKQPQERQSGCLVSGARTGGSSGPRPDESGP